MPRLNYIAGLARLHLIPEAEERNGTWRQGVAALAAAALDHRQVVPLEGVDVELFHASMAFAVATLLIDDVEWLSAPAASAALYELAEALPSGDVKRELGRRVLARLRKGDAATFVALATRLAYGAKRALAGAGVRARVALALDLPLGSPVRADGLALALISRRDVSREWLTVPSHGGLPSRRLAARLLERAAREAAQQFAEGDESGVRVFDTEVVHSAWTRLLRDREPLVWKHVASARGLLFEAKPALREETLLHLDASLGVTEWRRAAASLAASIAVDPERGFRECSELLSSNIFESDRGIAAAILLGLPRAAERQPDAVAQLVQHLVGFGGVEIAEALVELRVEHPRFAPPAAKRCCRMLRESLVASPPKDDGVRALIESLIEDLEPNPDSPTLRSQIVDAVREFTEVGAPSAWVASKAVITHATRVIYEIETRTDETSQEHRIANFKAVRELDLALLENDLLANLLALQAKGDEPGEEIRPLGDVFERMTDWMVEREQGTTSTDHFSIRMRRLRTFLHLVDADGRRVDDRVELLRSRRSRAAQTLFRRMQEDSSPAIRRTLCASVSRAADALVREDMFEVSDIVLEVGRLRGDARDIQTIAEASMVPDLEQALAAYARLEAALIETSLDEDLYLRSVVGKLSGLAQDLPVACSPRVEALRHALLDIARSLRSLAQLQSHSDLSDKLAGGEAIFEDLEIGLHALSRLARSARSRLWGHNDPEWDFTSAMRVFVIQLQQKLAGRDLEMAPAMLALDNRLRNGLPWAVFSVCSKTLRRVIDLPLHAERRSREYPKVSIAPKEAPLPAWIPASRVLGGFYIMRAIGSGNVGSVFVARRTEQSRTEEVEFFALKVPEYSGGAARTLSEEEFLSLFREEAGALLSLPRHQNIARFVTFDAGVRPKPILVMELVPGPSLEKAVELGSLSLLDVLGVLEGLAAGLAAMHRKGIAHLDVKPSNVILREGVETIQPVLVDFGLAGRNVRPGCGTANYGAPEVWGTTATATTALAADVYAFGCLAYELFTGATLFQESHDLATVAAHLAHDGAPPKILDLARNTRTEPLAELLYACLRRDPKMRPPIDRVIAMLTTLKDLCSTERWPLLSNEAAAE